MINQIKIELIKIEEKIGELISISYITDYHSANNYDFNIYLDKNKEKGINFIPIEIFNIINSITKLHNKKVEEIELINRKINNKIICKIFK
jgi:hypothetical protein